MASLRFAVLRHEGVAEPHYDVLLETDPDSPLAAWRADAWPPAGPMTWERLADHRREYLDYEGPVSNNRGSVKRIDEGSCEIEIVGEGLWQAKLKTRSQSMHLLIERTTGVQWRATIL